MATYNSTPTTSTRVTPKPASFSRDPSIVRNIARALNKHNVDKTTSTGAASVNAPDQTIFTINARGNILLPVTRDHFRLDGLQMSAEIWRMFTVTTRILSSKGVHYANLKSGLVPATKKHEAAFLFDTRVIASNSYGRECMYRLLPLLEPDATLSVLVGDLIADDGELAAYCHRADHTLPSGLTSAGRRSDQGRQRSDQ